MAVPHKVVIEGSRLIGSYPAAERIPFGGAVVASGTTAGAETIKPAIAAAMGILGFANKREWIPKGSYDGFYEAGEMVEVVADYACGLVQANGSNISIALGDWLEVAVIGGGSATHGTLEEAGSTAGAQFTVDTIGKALQSVTMTSSSYKVVYADVAVGDTSVQMTAGDPATMGLTVGDYIVLEDITADLQVNKVRSITKGAVYDTVGLVLPSTASLVATDNDLVTRLFPVNLRMV